MRGKASVQWGAAGDVPVPGDYTADGVTDLVMWRPSDGKWYRRGVASPSYGLPGDEPLPLPYAMYRSR